MGIRKKFFTSEGGQTVVESPSLEAFRKHVAFALGSWFTGGPGSAGRTVGLDDLRAFPILMIL